MPLAKDEENHKNNKQLATVFCAQTIDTNHDKESEWSTLLLRLFYVIH